MTATLFSHHSATSGVPAGSHPRRRLAQVLATAAVTGALTVGVAGTASAASAEPPPDVAWAAPAETSSPALGDGGQNYWATDNCHYYAQGGTWLSDMCEFALADASGNAIPGLYALFQNLGDGQIGQEVLRIDLSMSGYAAFATVTDGVVSQWVRISLSDSHIEYQGTTMAGGTQWITYVAPPAGQSPNTDTSYNYSPAGLINTALRIDNDWILTNVTMGGFISVKP